jgi:proteasome lid subunit RPN8/RPN11
LPKQSKLIQLLTRIDQEVRVLGKKPPRETSLYGKKLHVIVDPFVAKGTLENIELSRSAHQRICVPLGVLGRVLEEVEASPEREVIGIMLGSLERDMIVVSDAIPGEPTSSTHAVLTAEELTRLLDRGKLREPNAKFVGWYHSHLGIGVVPSKVDLGTQSVLQQFSPSIFALIVDPKTRELEAYITEAFSPITSTKASQDVVRFKLPLSGRSESG